MKYSKTQILKMKLFLLTVLVLLEVINVDELKPYIIPFLLSGKFEVNSE